MGRGGRRAPGMYEGQSKSFEGRHSSAGASRAAMGCGGRPAPGMYEGQSKSFEGRHGSAGASRAANGGLGGRPEPPMLD
jgi:hypothetical protein